MTDGRLTILDEPGSVGGADWWATLPKRDGKAILIMTRPAPTAASSDREPYGSNRHTERHVGRTRVVVK